MRPFTLLSIASASASVNALHGSGHGRALLSRDSPPGIPNFADPVLWGPPIYNDTFEQLIDHNNAALGTFSQRYWYNAQYWGGPGSPIIFANGGEANGAFASGDLSNQTLIGIYAQELKAAMVMIEHRYWGESSPYEVQDTKTFQYLTVDQTISDHVRFAETVKFPFDCTNSSNAPHVPWVFVGTSYSAMLAAWSAKFYPDVFWAVHAISAPVEIIHDFWQYWVPVQEGIPQNCSADIQRVVGYVDGVLGSGNKTAIAELKNNFGLGGLAHDDDFAAALTASLSAFEGTQFYTGTGSLVQEMCDAIEGVSTGSGNPEASSVPATGVGLDAALANYASFMSETYVPGLYCTQTTYMVEIIVCGDVALENAANLSLYDDWLSPTSVACFDTYNLSSPRFTDKSPLSAINRRWMWLSCNEPTFWNNKIAPPPGQPSIVSRLLTSAYFDDYCDRLFPPEDGYSYGVHVGRTEATINAHTGGWDWTDTMRLIWSNGEHDPWRTESVSSPYRPGGPLPSTADRPVLLVPGGWHCSDFSTGNGAANAAVQAIQDQEVAIITKWVDEFHAQKGGAASKL